MFFFDSHKVDALTKAVDATLKGGSAQWPNNGSALLLKKMAERLYAAQQERDRAKAEAEDATTALRHLEGRFELVASGTTDGLWDIGVIAGDPSHPDSPVWWSPQMRRLLGFASEQDFPNVLDSWVACLHPDDKQPTLDAFAAHLADRSGRTPYDVENRLRLKSGEYRWFRAFGTTERDAQGLPLRVAGSLTDITERREREQFLDITLTRFELGSQMLSDGLWDMSVIAGDPINPNNEFWWSQQFRHLLGFESEQEFPNVLDSWASRLHPEDKERSLNAFAAHLNDRSGRTNFDIEYRLQLKNGQYRWFRARGLTKRAADGTPLRAVGALMDVEAGRQLGEVANTLSSAAGDIVRSNDDLSRRTEQQAAALEETASSMEEMTSIVRKNAEGARQANSLASKAAETALHGGELVNGVVSTMAAIQASSRKIGEIITVIDGIAFQTNILALNAAVEAARAGEQGRGFAVVASEVRSLAQRCTMAAKEIRDLIADSGAKVGQGAEQVNVAGKAMEELLSSVRQVNDIMSGIAAASHEQSAGIEQINQTISQMDAATQQNSALVDTMASSARALEDQATALVESVANSSRSVAGKTKLALAA
ncbi:membrane-anchored chemotaxis sensory transducer [Xanthomonas arboricola pv. fragariae]|uniref:methyl-accepting chemotaxis protein n=1 Tax=Xanthomonas arboricola TaxID=56448 RepID=UPI000C845F68|nr:PAS domain-containing methyl-accepting chemotaxis protein [Xanthomonas arboricola]SOT99035.1 membrane-anchored chemotaxis sensory transducer [Xanthomonas arboricola pv. fragariae]